jgi:hypothetical protein
MIIKRPPSRISKEGIRSGFKIQDEAQLRKETDEPRIQLFTDEELDEPEDKAQYYYVYYYAYSTIMCKSRLEHLPKLEYWQCSSCQEVYDTKYIHDTPLKSITDHKLMPYSDLQYYPQAGENDPSQPFVAAINVDDNQVIDQDPNFQVIRSSPDQR